MDTVGAYEAKTHLGRLLDRVADGETLTISNPTRVIEHRLQRRYCRRHSLRPGKCRVSLR